MRKICLRNPEIKLPRCFISAEIASLDLKLLPLIQKKIEIDSIVVSDFAANFFTDGPVKSWQKLPSPPEGVDAATRGTKFVLRTLRIERGSIAHETPVLPLPLGISQFALEAKGSDNLEATFEATFPDKGTLVGKLAAPGVTLPPAEMTGWVKATNLGLSTADRRLNGVSGKFDIVWKSNQLQLTTEGARVSTLRPIVTAIDYRGMLLLNNSGEIVAGKGSLGQAGLAVEFNDLRVSRLQGISVSYSGAAELKRFLPALGLDGTASFKGALASENSQGTLGVQNLTYGAFNAPQLTATYNVRLRDPLAISASVAMQSLTYPAHALGAFNLAAGTVEAMKFDARYEPTRVNITSGTARLMRGNVAFSYERDLRNELQNVALIIQRLKAQDLSRALNLTAEIISDVDGNAKLSWIAGKFPVTASGSVALKLSRGRIKDSFFQRGLLKGPLHKLEEKLVDVEFASALADVSMTKGALALKTFYFDAEEWNVTLRAEASGGEGKAALAFRFRSSFVDNVANPIYMGIESRRDGDFYDLPFACRGKIFSASCYVQNW